MMDLNKVVTNVERAVRNLAVALKGILDRSFNSHRYRRRVSYNGRYWEITEIIVLILNCCAWIWGVMKKHTTTW